MKAMGIFHNAVLAVGVCLASAVLIVSLSTDTRVAASECATTDIPNADLPAGFCATTFASIESPRGAIVDSSGDLVVVSSQDDSITIMWDDNGDWSAGNDEQVVFATRSGLNHAVLEWDGFLYASSSSTVYRWPYTPGARVEASEAATVFVKQVPSNGHTTRSLEAHNGILYVQVGSVGNVDNDATQAAIRMVDLSLDVPTGGHAWSDLDVFADGLRNEVGLFIDHTREVLYGVENGVDRLSRDDLGGDIHEDNPCEEINMFPLDQVGLFYGYPNCWSEFILDHPSALGAGGQWAHPNFIPDTTDEWCRDTDNVVPPALCLPAHTAPLGVVLHDHEGFPEAHRGMFVALHGSWNRDVEQGYKIVHVEMDAQGNPTGFDNFFQWDEASPTGGDDGNGWGHRPVDVAVGPQGQLFFTSDRTDIVGVIYYAGVDGDNDDDSTGDDDDDSTGDDDDDSAGDDDDSTGDDDDDSTGDDDDDSAGDDDDTTSSAATPAVTRFALMMMCAVLVLV